MCVCVFVCVVYMCVCVCVCPLVHVCYTHFDNYTLSCIPMTELVSYQRMYLVTCLGGPVVVLCGLEFLYRLMTGLPAACFFVNHNIAMHNCICDRPREKGPFDAEN